LRFFPAPLVTGRIRRLLFASVFNRAYHTQ
jgi:hypothetical protein